MKIKTSELLDAALDWTVAKCEDLPVYVGLDRTPMWRGPLDVLHRAKASTDWTQGGPIVEREKICPDFLLNGQWLAVSRLTAKQGYGPTPLIAAMRCYVASKIGEEVEVPDELAS